MAVDKVTGPIFAADTADGGSTPVSAKLVYEVSYDTNTETAVDALSATDGTTTIPSTGNAHPSNANLILKEKSSARLGASSLFRIVCTYGTKDSTTVGDKGTSPLDRPVRWSSSERGGTQEVDTDSAGALIATSAKETVAIPIPYSDKGLVAVLNEDVPVGGLPPDYDAFFNKVNDDVYKGNAAKRLLLTGVTSQFTEELYDGSTIQYFSSRFNFSLLIKRTNDANDVDTWEQRILNEGTMELDDNVPPEQKDIRNVQTNTVITSPVNLDAVGKVLATDAAPLFLNNGPAVPTVAGKVDVFLTADFDLLGL